MINVETIRKWWSVFVRGGFCEVRILGRFQYSGYFRDVENLIAQIEPYAKMDDEQCYFTLNAINADCYGRQQSEKFIKSPKVTTNDTDIMARQWVMVDFDPVRATGVNASDEEFELAHKKARTVFKYLREQGFNDPVICKSGNGWHLQYLIDCPNTEENTETVKRFLQSLGKMFTDDKVDIDEKVFNAGRICKLYGTVAKKGANIGERPWRMSEIVYIPKELAVTDMSVFQKIADLLPKEEPKALPNQRRAYSNGQPFDLPQWLNAHGIKYREKKSGGSTLYELEECPWIETHSDRKKWDSALFVDGEGKITFNCTHSHCKGKTWHDVRLKYEPNAYDRPAYPMMSMYQRGYVPMQPQKPKYQIKEETEELGKKWLSMDEIEKIDLSAIPRVKTGITALDKLLLGLAECEVTMLSGSNASGKSSWLNTLICNLIEQRAPTALFSGELPKQILKAWIQMVAAGKANLLPSTYGDGKYYVPNHVAKRIDAWMKGFFYLFNNDYGNTWAEVFADMDEMVERGVKVFILDNLMALDIDLLEGDKNNKQKELILQIKEYAKKNHVHIILVAHPRKAMAFLRKNDIAGSGDLTNVVDNVFIAHRVNQDFFKAGAEFYGADYIRQFQEFGNVIEVSKNRMFGVCDVLVGMHYEIESRRFKNTFDEVIHYGWEREPTQSAMEFGNNPAQVSDYIMTQPESNYVDENLPFGAPSDDAPF